MATISGADMRVFLRGKTYWTEFYIYRKYFQLGTKSKDKRQAEEIATAIRADMIQDED